MARKKKTAAFGVKRPHKIGTPPPGCNPDAWHVGRLITAGNALALMLAETARPSTEARICAIAEWQMVSADALK